MRPFGRPECRWVGNIKLDLNKYDMKIMADIYLAQDRNKSWALVTVICGVHKG